MDHNHDPLHHPIVSILIFLGNILLYVDAQSTADQFRSWTSWGLGIFVSILLIIINYPKAKETLTKRKRK